MLSRVHRKRTPFNPAPGASLVAQSVKNLPAMQETWVRSLGWEDSLEKEMVTHFSILAWRIPWTEEPSGQRADSLEKTLMLGKIEGRKRVDDRG